jgi:50S ribosomal subunit-associated GTPase HflX
MDIPESHQAMHSLVSGLGNFAAVSAQNRQGLDILLSKVDEICRKISITSNFFFPMVVKRCSTIRRYGKIEEIEYLADAARVKAVLPRARAESIKKILSGEKDGIAGEV